MNGQIQDGILQESFMRDPLRITIGQAIADLEILATVMEAAELRNRVE
jgi:hypothetical protein